MSWREWMGRAALKLIVAATLVGCGGDGSDTSPATLQPTGFFESDGLQIYYESVGEGHPLILVHGWSLDLESNWVVNGWVDALQSSRQVIALDVRGHGSSDKPHAPELYSYAAMARDVLNLMDHFGIDRADLMGYSLGSFSGTYLLGHHTERFTSMILGGIGDEDEESLAQAPTIAAALRTSDPSTITDPFAFLARAFVDLDPRNDREALALAALQMWPEGFPLELGGPGLGEAAIPVLIVNGDLDVPYVETDQNLAAALPRARLVRLPDRDHLTAINDPGFKKAVLDFLSEQSQQEMPQDIGDRYESAG